MCNQTVSLIAAELERSGISTVVIQLLREPAVKVRPPRSLLVPFRHGYPLDSPNAPELQHQVIEACLGMLESAELTAPALREYSASASG
ncbi:MAG: hypothetical protein EXS31_12690 [Pedosphaera sp.]|nr:hypothetical protein [Pedosphaera sp.]